MEPFEPQQLPIEEIRWDSLIPLIGRANRSLAYFDGVLYAGSAHDHEHVGEA